MLVGHDGENIMDVYVEPPGVTGCREAQNIAHLYDSCVNLIGRATHEFIRWPVG